jgi:hypothetical protein
MNDFLVRAMQMSSRVHPPDTSDTNVTQTAKILSRSYLAIYRSHDAIRRSDTLIACLSKTMINGLRP